MPDDDFGDWRIEAALTLGEDIPPAYPGGPSHKAGAAVYLSRLVKSKHFGLLGFVSPHPVALALSIALNALKRSNVAVSNLPIKGGVTPFGNSKLIPNDYLPQFFDFLESCMVLVTFSFQSIETFSNYIIEQHKDIKTEIKKKKGVYLYDYEEAIRYLSTEEKISKVLPSLLNIPSLSGNKIWGHFQDLKIVRDSTIHWKEAKSDNQAEIDSLYYHFLNSNLSTYVLTAYEVINYFFREPNQPRWWLEFKSILIKEGLCHPPREKGFPNR
jgi:hypothetical protein